MSARICTTRPGGISFLRPSWSFAREHRPFLPHPLRDLHTSSQLRAASANHYETLGLDPSASKADIKKKYYQLSKSTHPDRNPNDPNASARFSAVSDAYSTLGNEEKRARYDRDVMRTRGPAPARSGSYSSSQAGPNGSRPASGLSKRRSTFRGPPPSFYAAGGYGSYGKQRSAQAEAHADNARKSSGEQYSGGEQWDTSTAGGFSPGQGAPRGFDNDVPHFDREGHYRTQENVTGRTARRKNREYREHIQYETSAGMGTSSSFVFVSMAVGVAIVIPAWLLTKSNEKKRKSKP